MLEKDFMIFVPKIEQHESIKYYYYTSKELNFIPGFAPRRIRTNIGNEKDFVFHHMNKKHTYAIYHQIDSDIVLEVIK